MTDTTQKNKIIMVDMDGTLVDTAVANHMAYREALREYGYDMTIEEYREKCDGRVYRDFLPLFVGEDAEMMEKVHDMKLRLYPQFMKYITVNARLVDIIKALRTTHYTALVTTASKKSVYNILELCGLTDLFDDVITQEDVKEMKPSPRCYEAVMKKYGISPENCMVFEDSDTGIASARASGARVFVCI